MRTSGSWSVWMQRGRAGRRRRRPVNATVDGGRHASADRIQAGGDRRDHPVALAPVRGGPEPVEVLPGESGDGGRVLGGDGPPVRSRHVDGGTAARGPGPDFRHAQRQVVAPPFGCAAGRGGAVDLDHDLRRRVAVFGAAGGVAGRAGPPGRVIVQIEARVRLVARPAPVDAHRSTRHADAPAAGIPKGLDQRRHLAGAPLVGQPRLGDHLGASAPAVVVPALPGAFLGQAFVVAPRQGTHFDPGRPSFCTVRRPRAPGRKRHAIQYRAGASRPSRSTPPRQGGRMG